MRPTVQHYVKTVLDRHPVKGKVLEVGSMNINGTIRHLFDGCEEYVGLDMRPGRGVDVVAKADNIPYDDEHFECVICCDTLEHDDAFWESMDEMKRVLKKEGLLILSVPGIGFGVHEYPSDYWRFTPSAIEIMLKGLNNIETWEGAQATVCGYGVK
jgi:SAM-dependent methyltransferase